MIEIIWTYILKPGRRSDFEKYYASGGDWAQLFGQAPGYRGTSLLRDVNAENRYATVDRWESLQAFEYFRTNFMAQYSELDEVCSAFTTEELHVGTFQS
jgi:heme-degrading monooxygenase HmoA